MWFMRVVFAMVCFGAGLWLSGCAAGFDGQPMPEGSQGSTGITLDTQVEQVFQTNCAACHSAGSTASPLTYVTDLARLATSSYVVPGDPAGSKLYQEVSQGLMPPGGGMSSTDIDVISRWISSLATSGTQPTPTPTPVPTPVPTPTPGSSASTFTSISKNILQKRCVSCHGGDGGYYFDSYTNTMKAVVAGQPNSSPLYTSVSTKRMPRGGTSLSATDIQAIYDWIAAGAKNN